MKYKVIIDGRIITPELTGIGRYTYEIIKNCSELGIDFIVLVNKKDILEKMFENIKDIQMVEMKSKFLSITEQFELPLILNRYADKNVIFHSPSFASSPFIKIPMIMTIHDLNHIRFPQFYSRVHKYYYEYIVKKSAIKSKKILTVSKFSKEEIVSWLKCNDEKIDVTYNGVDNKYNVINDKEYLNNIKLKYKLPNNFILYIGNQKLHKNIETLIKAIKNVSPDYYLVINGKENERLMKVAKSFGVSDRILFIGFVDEDDLPSIYNLATVFVYPSMYEGFGLPILEAMACGCPVLAANTSSLIEVCNNDDILFECMDYKNLSDKINELILNSNKRNKNILNGIEQSKLFSWENTAKQTVDIYNSVIRL